MQQEGARPVVALAAAAANDDLIAPAEGAQRVDAPLGWDPFEVWRTRVRPSADLERAHEAERH